eukprot:1161500-Pelagomonas_calceolata.AAC.7
MPVFLQTAGDLPIPGTGRPVCTDVQCTDLQQFAGKARQEGGAPGIWCRVNCTASFRCLVVGKVWQDRGVKAAQDAGALIHKVHDKAWQDAAHLLCGHGVQTVAYVKPLFVYVYGASMRQTTSPARPHIHESEDKPGRTLQLSTPIAVDMKHAGGNNLDFEVCLFAHGHNL